MPEKANRLAMAALILVVAGCAVERSPDHPSASVPVSTVSTPPPAPTRAPDPAPTRTAATNPKLRTELLAMLAADQKSRQSADVSGVRADQARTERLQAIVATHGWPTRTLVGDDGATAAWAIAQHSDLDPEFQRRALELMRPAVAAGDAHPGELAYLTDRVAANAGQPQTYGTQMGCGPDGRPQLVPLVEPDRVDQLRAEAGLPPLADYLAELTKVCAEPARAPAVFEIG